MPRVDLENYKPSWADKRQIALGGSKYLGKYKKPGFKEAMPFYAFHCKKHGYVVNYPYGYSERLECPKC